MAEYDMSKSTTEKSSSDDFSVDRNALDYVNVGETGETTWDFPDATQNFGYYKEIPEFKKALDALATWTTGKGWEVGDNKEDKVVLEHLTGWGEDTFQSIMWNMIIVKKVVGDSFAEIIRKNNTLINLKPISPERVRLVIDSKGRIKRYDIKNSKGEFTAKQPKDILHLCNDRIADEIHGTSVLTACKWVIDARNEALADARKVFHRNVFPLQIIEYDGENTNKRDALLVQYADAIKTGKALVVPKDVIQISDAGVTIQDPIVWIKYLENFFYQAVGVPKIILGGADEHSEAGGKVGYLTFEPTYVQEQTQLETDILNQMGIEVTFNRPASLGGTIQQDEAKNTGQVGIQPNDVEASLTPE